MAWTLVDNIHGRNGRDGVDGRHGVNGRNGVDGARGDRGERGPRGPAGTISSATFEAVPADEPGAVIMSGTEDVKHLHIQVPRGLPGVNAAPADEAVAAYIAATGSASNQSLLRLVPVYRVWDNGYPPRIEGALNIFLGPVNPGLLMGPDDRWENPNLIALDDVTAAMSTPGTALRKVTESFVTPAKVFIPASDFAAVDTRAATAFKPLSAANVSAGLSGWFFPKDGDQPYVSTVVRVPDGWATADIKLYFTHNTAEPDGDTMWRVRVQPFTPGTGVQDQPSGMTYVRRYTPVESRVLELSGPFTTAINPSNTPPSRLYMVVINRQTGDELDVAAHPVAVVGAELSRLT